MYNVLAEIENVQIFTSICSFIVLTIKMLADAGKKARGREDGKNLTKSDFCSLCVLSLTAYRRLHLMFHPRYQTRCYGVAASRIS